MTQPRYNDGGWNPHNRFCWQPPERLETLLPCTCNTNDVTYCPRHTPLPGEQPQPHKAT